MKPLLLILTVLFLCSCGGPVPRKPVEVKTGTFMKESKERNKELLAREESRIREVIAADTLHEYQLSAAGSWYAYEVRNEEGGPSPEAGDRVTLQYNVMSLENDTLYSAEEIGTLTYVVDREDKPAIFPGIRSGIKLLKEGETALFLFPSSLAYGYTGDREKIGTNLPIKSKITLLQLEKQQDSLQN